MAGQDIPMNAFKLLADAAYIYGEASDSSQGKVKKSDLFKEVFQDRGKIQGGTDFNTILNDGIYQYYIELGEVINGPSLNRIILICFKSSSHIAHLAVNVHPGIYAIKYRTSHDYGKTWNSWKSISIT